MAKKTGRMVSCEQCGKLVYKTQYLLEHRDHQFCSQECAIQWRHVATHEKRLCEVCGAEFECAKKSTQRFCSTDCQAKWQTTLTGENNPKYSRLCVRCDWCGKEVIVKRYKAVGDQKIFCSTVCRQAWYANIWSQRDSWREESRRRAVDLLSSGVCSHVDTAPQRIVNGILDELNVPYVNEFPLGGYSMDNKLGNDNLYIEVMGDYWHALPAKYSCWNTLTQHQQKRIRADAGKHEYVTKVLGAHILYLWESDCIANRAVCKALIQWYCANHGALQNYHSYNYTLSNGVLRLKDNILEAPWFSFNDEIAS